MNDLATYRKVCHRMLPGDVIAFGGQGILSTLVRVFTGSALSHVGMVSHGEYAGLDVQMLESVLDLKLGIAGCRSIPLEAKLSSYGGRAWWLPLRGDLRRHMDLNKFFRAARESDNVPYDVVGLFAFMLRDIPILGTRIAQEEDHDEMFCSGLDTALLKASGVLRGVNWSQVTPQQLAEMNLYSECVQLIGEPAEIARFNTV